MSARSTSLEFAVSAEAAGQIYEAVVCLSKIGETVSLEARHDRLTLISLNLSKTTYAACTLDAKTFFVNYKFSTSGLLVGGDRFTAQLYNKALQCAFKGRTGDPRGRETPIDTCHVSIQERSDQPECRMIVRMQYKNGMTKCYRLTYEPTQIMHALFDKTSATQGWKLSSRVMREYIEFFGPKTEQLNLVARDGKAIFISFTEKIQDGKEVLKQPLETSISLHIEEFEDFHVREQSQIVISVKDFKAIVVHAETMHGSIEASFSQPGKPMQLTYSNPGINCAFTLMTTGEAASSASPNTQNTFISNRSTARQALSASAQRSNSEMPPPPLPRGRSREEGSGLSQVKKLRLDQPTPAASQRDADPDPESLFMPAGEEQQWEPPNFDDDGQDEQLGYDPSYGDKDAAPHPTFRDARITKPMTFLDVARESQDGLDPTQRLSQLHGMFD